MLELWNSWYDTLASVEALATVIVIVLVASGAITLAETRRQKTRATRDWGSTRPTPPPPSPGRR